MNKVFEIQTRGSGLHEFTEQVSDYVSSAGKDSGLLTLFVRHTSCSLLISENADPDVRADMNEFFRRLVPDTDQNSMSWVRHTCEGPDDMPAHIKAAMTPVSISIPIVNGRLALGTWQGIFLFEHRDRPHRRTVAGHISA
ncbi:MAG: YjbQ family protein [Hellea sp.]|nr:YjbQ family protein [Hellea sp.]